MRGFTGTLLCLMGLIAVSTPSVVRLSFSRFIDINMHRKGNNLLQQLCSFCFLTCYPVVYLGLNTRDRNAFYFSRNDAWVTGLFIDYRVSVFEIQYEYCDCPLLTNKLQTFNFSGQKEAGHHFKMRMGLTQTTTWWERLVDLMRQWHFSNAEL